MLYNISWAGKNVRNYYSSRAGHKPIAIVNHISAGSMTSMLNTFENPASKASSDYAISRAGEVVQYVRWQDGHAAWTQGISLEKIPLAKAPIVKAKGVNPNLYCVSIEYEGYVVRENPKDPASPIKEYHGLNGDITEEQFWAGVWLHRFIKEEAARIFESEILLNSYHVLGHFQIDKGKPVCPGPLFPWPRMYAELAIADSMSFEEYEERLSYLRGENAQAALIVQLAFRIDELVGKLGGQWDTAARYKLDRFTTILVQHGFHQDSVPTDKRIKWLYETWRGGEGHSAEAYRKLMVIAGKAKNESLI